jgi:Tol biopolymer transport system component
MIRELATGKERRVQSVQRDLEHPTWTPDGKHNVYNSFEGDHSKDVEMMQVDDPSAAPKVLLRGSGPGATSSRRSHPTVHASSSAEMERSGRCGPMERT